MSPDPITTCCCGQGHMLVRRGPFENRTRPAVNALFRSAAIAYGARVIGVVLTGLLDDGTDGLIAIKAVGGTSMVQDPNDAEWPSMPRNALKRDHVDHAVKLDEMGALLSRLCREEVGPSIPPPEDYMVEDRIAAQDFASIQEDLVDARTRQQDLLPRLRRGAQPDRRRQGNPVPLPGRPRLHAPGPGGHPG
jgi:hypothetical protein